MKLHVQSFLQEQESSSEERRCQGEEGESMMIWESQTRDVLEAAKMLKVPQCGDGPLLQMLSQGSAGM